MIHLGGETNDRIDQVLAVMETLTDKISGMEKKVNGIEETVQTISDMEDATAEHVAKLEDKVDDVIKKEGEHFGDVTKKVDDVTKQVGVVTKKVRDLSKQIDNVKKQVKKVDSDVIYSTWKFVGRGWQLSHEAEFYKDGTTTLKECLEFCQTKRMSDGGEWNGVTWNEPTGTCCCEKNDRGHVEVSYSLHFRAQ